MQMDFEQLIVEHNREREGRQVPGKRELRSEGFD